MGKIGIIGMGWVGTSIAASILARNLASELLLNDVRGELAAGEAMDFADGQLFYHRASVRSADVEEMIGCDVVIISAGRGGKPEESRLDLLRDNAAIARDLAARLAGIDGIIVVVSNPVDILTEVVRQASGLPVEGVLGTGTTLDSARLRKALGDHLGVHPKSIHAQVLGEHGDSEFVHWSRAQVGGRSLRGWDGWSAQDEVRIAEQVRRAAYEIIRRKGATNHAIGMVTASLVNALINDEQRVLTVSRHHTGACGVREVALSLPAVVGAGGAQRVHEPELDAGERAALERSAELLRARLRELPPN